MMSDVLEIVPLFFLGLYAGSLLTEAAVLVPAWRALTPAQFFEMHKSVGPRLYRYFAPVTVLGVAAPVIAVGLALSQGQSVDFKALVGVGLCLCALATYFLYFQRANRSFAERSLSDSALGAELKTWASLHAGRTVMVIVAFALLVWAYSG
jgi:Domain of unknown function (DUF1772)